LLEASDHFAGGSVGAASRYDQRSCAGSAGSPLSFTARSYCSALLLGVDSDIEAKFDFVALVSADIVGVTSKWDAGLIVQNGRMQGAVVCFATGSPFMVIDARAASAFIWVRPLRSPSRVR
jgi:hypothetical protein